MKILPECIPCFVRQAFDAALSSGLSPESTESMVKHVMRDVARMDWRKTPPLVGREIQNVLKLYTKDNDPYAARKKKQTETALGLLPQIEHIVATASDPFVEAVRFSIAGNAIDLGTLTDVSPDVTHTFKTALNQPLPMDEIHRLKKEIASASSVLFLTDNCGEVIFDQPLMALIGAEKLTVGMRGMPTINDATVDDASMCLFPPAYKIISNGSDVPGTWLPECCDEFVNIFNEANVVIAKGQGNYETLSCAKRSIYFMLLVKCPAIAKDTGCTPGTYYMKRSDGKPPAI